MPKPKLNISNLILIEEALDIYEKELITNPSPYDGSSIPQRLLKTLKDTQEKISLLINQD